MGLSAATPRGPLTPAHDTTWRVLAADLAHTGRAVGYAHCRHWTPRTTDDDWVRRLLGPEWPRYLRARRHLTRSRLVASRWLLRTMVSRLLDTDPATVRLSADGCGRPVVLTDPPVPLSVSLSHTGDLVVAGLSLTGPIGVDVEARDRPLLALGIAEAACDRRERLRIDRLPHSRRNARLVRLWTLKEAYAKALGVGLSVDFRTLGFRLGNGWAVGEAPPPDDPAGYHPAGHHPTGHDPTGHDPASGPAQWRFNTAVVADGYCVSVATGPDSARRNPRQAWEVCAA